MPQGISAVRPTNGLYLYHYFGFIITVINISLSPITCLFFLILLPFNQKSYSMLKLQVSDCSTSRILCYVPNMATFCRESIECFLDTVMNFFILTFLLIFFWLQFLLMCTHFPMFHAPYISIHKLLYFTNNHTTNKCTNCMSFIFKLLF